MKKKNRILLIILCCIVLVGGGCFYYLTDFYPAHEEAILVEEQAEGLEQRDNLTILSPQEAADTAIIFYPGAKVEAKSYLPLLDQLRDIGLQCIMVEMPFNMALFDSDAAKEVIAEFPEVEHWYMMGHSMGGAFGSKFVSENPELFEGLILLGAYPYGEYSLENTLTIYGSLNTSVAEEIDYTENVVVIEGGNHAQFGNYGPQKGDLPATISAEEQQRQTVEAIKTFVAKDVIEHPLYSDDNISIIAYSQSPEKYGISNSKTWVIAHVDDKDIVLQKESLSMPIFAVPFKESFYIFGETRSFSTVSGINITKYTIADDQVLIENAIDADSLTEDFYLYKDELNQELCSIIPKAEDGMGRAYFQEIKDLNQVLINIVNGSDESIFVLKLNEEDKYIIEEHEGIKLPIIMENLNIYHPDADFNKLISTTAEFEEITAEGLLEKIVEYNELPAGIKLLSMAENTIDGKQVLSLDLSEEYKTYVGTMGTSGEFFAIQSIVNTFVEAFGADGVQLTVGGEILETGHNVYDYVLEFAE